MSQLEDSEGLRERLRATIDHVAQQAGAQRLRMALVMGDGFSLELAACNTPRVATALQLWLEDEAVSQASPPVASLPSVHPYHPGDAGSERALQVERISPYPLDPSAAGPSSLDTGELVEHVFARLSDEESKQKERLVFVDASRATSHDAEAWRTLLMRFNERRNAIARLVNGPFVIISPPWLDVELPRWAPDLWSIRSVSVEIGDLDQWPEAAVLQACESPYWTATDVAELVERVEAARASAASGRLPSMRALGVLLLRLAGVKKLSGDLHEAEQLIEEATTLAERTEDPAARAACQLAHSELLVSRGELDEAHRLIESAKDVFVANGDEWALADAWGRLAEVLALRGQLDESLRVRREQQLPVYERLGDERSLLAGRTNLALSLGARRRPEDGPEMVRLLALALRDARRLRLPEAREIAEIIRSLGRDPDAPPFA